MIDARVIQALEGIVQAGKTHQRACLIGGQALRDLYEALTVRIGPDIPAVRASQDLDLLLSIGNDQAADRALHAVLDAAWSPKPGKPATYAWRSDPAIELDLATTYGDGDQPARAVKITVAGGGRILAYRMIPAWLHGLNLMEPCHAPALRRIGLERLRHTALLVSKLLAVDACLTALADPKPPAWTDRVDRDLDDVCYLTEQRMWPSLWCAASSAKRAELHLHLDPLLNRIRTWASQPPVPVAAETLGRIRQVIDGLPFWWH